MEFKTIEATEIGSQTLVGYSGPYPRPSGNCFSLKAEGNYYKILNFGAENLNYALNNGLITWPIRIHPLSENHAVIHDERIPHNWYQDRFCNLCTPKDLLPITQQLHNHLDILSGAREESNKGWISFYFDKQPKWESVK